MIFPIVDKEEARGEAASSLARPDSSSGSRSGSINMTTLHLTQPLEGMELGTQTLDSGDDSEVLIPFVLRRLAQERTDTVGKEKRSISM